MGHLKEEPDFKMLEYLKGADCVFAPAHGKPWIPVPTVAKLIRQIEPKIIIPALFTNDIKPFLKEFPSKEKIDPQEKLNLKKKDIEGKEMQIICLKP